MRRFASLSLVFLLLLATVAFAFGYRIPSVSWFFFLGGIGNESFGEVLSKIFGRELADVWLVSFRFGWVTGLLALGGAIWISWKLWQGKLGKLTEGDLRRWRRFQSIRRGYIAFWIVLVFIGLGLLDFLLVGNRALVVKTEGGFAFPAFRVEQFQNEDFGLEGAQEPNYRKLEKQLKLQGQKAWVLMPVVPWAPTLDADVKYPRELSVKEGKLYGQNGKLFSGVALGYHPSKEEGKAGLRARQARVRDGLLDGTEERFDEQGSRLGYVRWEKGKAVGIGKGIEAGSIAQGQAALVGLQETLFNPLPPLWEKERRHFLGTDSKGWDVLAQLYGGWQLILRGLFLYLIVTYFLGILIGTAMGYYGGVIDVVAHRITEILSAVPLLLLIMILGAQLKENLNILILVGLFCLFRWIGVASYLRTLTYREKARDYVLAARSMGAGTMRILWKHILPNTVALLVTLLPFEMVFFSGFLTALDFIGYGLPESYPSWGRLMADGLSQLQALWIVSSVFVTLTVVLLLFTFIGEAVREAFDPKKFSTYQ